MSKNLRTFLNELAQKYLEEIVEVDREVDPRFELTSIAAKLEKQGKSPVIFFRKVKGSRLPAVINVCASYERMALALGTTVQNLAEEYAKRERSPIPVKEVGSAPVKEVVIKGEDVDLGILPIPTHNELDAGPYISAGPTVMKDPDTGALNMGLYRLQVQGKDELGLFINPANHGYLIGERYRELGRKMEVAVVIGHHPALLLASVSKLEGFGGEYEVAGALIQEPLEVIKGETVDIMVPAQAEIVIEGEVDPEVKRPEGPFGEWPHYYTGTGDRWFIKVKAITMRRDAIYQTVFGAHNEHNVIGAVPRMGSLLRRVKGALPTVKAVNLPLSGGGRAICYISLKKRSDGEPKQAAFAALSAETDIKFVVLVDDDIDVFNEQEVLWAVATRFQADKDLIIMPYCLGAHLNPSAYDITRLKHGVMETKLILDATKPAPPTPFPPKADVPKEMLDKIELEKYLKPFSGL
jgi:2,5-furandicarboxylate decarboxylase 1